MNKLSEIEPDRVSTLSSDSIEIGQWFWVNDLETDWRTGVSEKVSWLGCVVSIGSNYVEAHGPKVQHKHGSSQKKKRIHISDLFSDLRQEHDPVSVIAKNVSKYRHEASGYLSEIKKITEKLGVVTKGISHNDIGKEDSTSLALMSKSRDVNAYSDELKKIRDEDIPKLFDLMRDANASMTQWMSAETLPLESAMGSMKDITRNITDKVFNVSLYAGLIETLTQFSKGEPANYSDKLHIMQRKLYMDEECLLDYKSGGIDFNSINDFDEWLSIPDNMNRILPFERCIVALQVRRKAKDRDSFNSISRHIINMQIENADKSTFLYIRNGENLYWLETELDFDDLIFPDKSIFDPCSPLMMMDEHSKFKFMSVDEFKSLKDDFEKSKKNFKEWELNNPKDIRGSKSNPFYGYNYSFSPDKWVCFNQDSVYYDDATKQLMDIMKKYNRISLIIQGLFDRSESLHPHPPIKTWQPESFSEGVKLVYDGAMTLYDGEAPDIDSYIAECNKKITYDSVLFGQYDYWVKKETAKECKRLDNDWRTKTDWRPSEHIPAGNDGPPEVSVSNHTMMMAKKAKFNWMRDRLGSNYYNDDKIKTSVTVPFSDLFNISAYKIGDYKKFFADPRTRKEYLKWVPMLIAAEEYWRKVSHEND